MPRVLPLPLPDTLPEISTIRSWGDDASSYDPAQWESVYRSRRYLGRVSSTKLMERHASLDRNMRALVRRERSVIPIQTYLSSWYWFRKEYETRLEFAWRGLPPPATVPSVLANPIYDAPTYQGADEPAALYRYGARQFMEQVVTEGRVRVCAASTLKSLEGDAARQDDERVKDAFLPGAYTSIRRGDGTPIHVTGDIRLRTASPDYFVLCLSCEWDETLFGDFRADSCVCIRDAETFASRMEAAMRSQLPDWYFHHNPVEYFDPYDLLPGQYLDAPTRKDFRFAYQREYRLIWIPPMGTFASGFRFATLGPLLNQAELRGRGFSGSKDGPRARI